MEKIKVDFCVIGGGSAGLSFASKAVRAGFSTVLIEGHKMGGDCLNYGCVPSKALIAAAKSLHNIQHSSAFGIKTGKTHIDEDAVYQHIKNIVKSIEPHDSVERYSKMGVHVIEAMAEFISPELIRAQNYLIQARKIIIATGSQAIIPPLLGIEKIDYLTNENLFYRRKLPQDLIILGGGVIGIEMAQAHRRLGVDVTLVTMDKILPQLDEDMGDYIRSKLSDEGIKIIEDHMATEVTANGDAIMLTAKSQLNKSKLDILGKNLLIAVGRKARFSELNLAAGDIACEKGQILLNNNLQSVSNKKVYVIGDAASRGQFTHLASYHATQLLRFFQNETQENLTNYRSLPYVIFTDPELAHTGLCEKDLAAGSFHKFTLAYTENDQARASLTTQGIIKLLIHKKDNKIAGCTIGGAHGAELLQFWTFAIENDINLEELTNCIMPYPSYSELNKRIADKALKQLHA